MDPYFDEDDTVIETNEYPDPEYLPSFAWLGVRNAGPPGQSIGNVEDDTEQLTSEDGSPNGSPLQDQIYADVEVAQDANRLSVDPDFQYQDDSDE